MQLYQRNQCLNGRQKVLNAFESEIFPKVKQEKNTSILDKGFNHKQLKVLTPKQMLRRL